MVSRIGCSRPGLLGDPEEVHLANAVSPGFNNISKARSINFNGVVFYCWVYHLIYILRDHVKKLLHE